MKTKLLTLAVLMAALALAVPFTAQAQVTPTRSGTLTVPTVIVGEVTTNVAQTVTLQSGQGFAFIPTFVGSNTISDNVIFTFQLSADGTNYNTANTTTKTNAVNGTTTVRGYHIFTPNELIGATHIRLYSINNVGVGNITNSSLAWSIPR